MVLAQTTVEEIMASIDGNYPNKIKLTRYKYLVKTLMTKTGATEIKIGDVTAGAKDLLEKEYGKKVTLLELLEGVNRNISSASKIDYATAMAAYVMLLGR